MAVGTLAQMSMMARGVPTATNGYILARQLGGDGPLSANLIAVETVLAMITLPLIWFTAIHFGLA